MHQQSERDYLELRRRTSEEKARAALDPAIGRIHQEFAKHYTRRLANEHNKPGTPYSR
ncbi:hypothetical protein ACFB49_26710 [Sphingomonas sp. DBB INV C78]|uniref:hypothetical protein n=1 Tax=Sphingomonas sp. DBB INV C78 TaxID=3349434 RepID=UPI0036D373E5